jgi:hypothetical protein
MAVQQRALRRFKSIAGAAIFVLGMFILYENLAGAFTKISDVVAKGSKALGVLPAAALAVSQAVHASGFDHQRVFCGLFHQVLLSAWPLLLVVFGTVLSRDNFADNSNVRP